MGMTGAATGDPAPDGRETTSPEEQADDDATVLTALRAGSAEVFGTSSGGNFALCLMFRHPELVRGAILHEPGLCATTLAKKTRRPARRCGPQRCR
jgi:pimeloyl-ACP methyl ester carboxylesterase